MKKATILLLLSAFFIFISCNTYEYDYYGSVTGVVVDEQTNNPIPDALIRLMPGSMTTTTSADGRFTFEELQAIQYTLSVESTGYEYVRVTLIPVSGEDITTTIRLKRL